MSRLEGFQGRESERTEEAGDVGVCGEEAFRFEDGLERGNSGASRTAGEK
jgi:hypothetical protein